MLGNKQIEGIRNTEKESKEGRLTIREKISLELKVQRSKREYESTAIMAQRAVGEDDVWKGMPVAKISFFLQSN